VRSRKNATCTSPAATTLHMKTVFTGPKSLVVPRASSTRRSRWMTPVSPRAIAEIKMRAALWIEEMAGRSRRQRQLAPHLACRRCDAQDRLRTAALMDFLADGAPMRGEAEHADGLCGGSFLGHSCGFCRAA
jgi:hypothetical protein